VAGAVNGTEGEAALIGLPVASNLALMGVLLPLASLVPVERFNPVLGANSGDCTIGVTRVVEHLDLAGEGLIDPLRTLLAREVVDATLAKVPSLHVVRDVHSFAHLVRVHVVKQASAPSARRELVQLSALLPDLGNPRSVVGRSHKLSVNALVTLVKVREARLLGLRVRSQTPAGAIDIVDIDAVGNGSEFVIEAHALVRDAEHVGHVPVAVLLLESVLQVLADQRVPVAHFDVGALGIVLPVGDTITDGETLEVGLEDVIVVGVLLVVLVDVVGEVRHVDASIGLTRDEEIVLLVLRELFEPLEHNGKIVCAALVVIEGAVLDRVAVGVANTSRLLDVEQVGLAVPRVLVGVELGAAALEAEGTVLLHEAEHGRATGATVEPDQDGGVSRVVLGFEEEIMDLLGGVGDIDIAREGTILVESTHLGERLDTVLLKGGQSDGSH